MTGSVFDVLSLKLIVRLLRDPIDIWWLCLERFELDMGVIN